MKRAEDKNTSTLMDSEAFCHKAAHEILKLYCWGQSSNNLNKQDCKKGVLYLWLNKASKLNCGLPISPSAIKPGLPFLFKVISRLNYAAL